MRRLAFLSTIACLCATVPFAATAESLPEWKLGDICAHESAPGQCIMFEAAARRTLSGSWGLVLQDVRRECLSHLSSSADHSYRLLAGCIDERTGKVLDEHAVQTAATPSEPVPAPKQADAAPDNTGADVPAATTEPKQ